MATVTHRIISSYQTDDRERLEIETGQIQIHASTSSGTATAYDVYDDIIDISARRENEEDESIENLWQTENATFGLSKRILRPPVFVPASSAYSSFDDTGGFGGERPVDEEAVEDDEEDIGSWYRSLSRHRAESQNLSAEATRPSTTITMHPKPSTSSTSSSKPKPHRDKNPWFITRSLPASSSSTPHPQESLTSTLSRTLPPSPAGEKKAPGGETPPVFLTIGPWNKGYQMLNRYGWEEGEALGLSVKRRGLGFRNAIKETEEEQTGRGGYGLNRENAIDLTLSDSDMTIDDDEAVFLQPQQAPSSDAEDPSMEIANAINEPDRNRDTMALITPLRATLKSDRLGIGLKPKSRHKHVKSHTSLSHPHSHRRHQQSTPSSQTHTQSQPPTPAQKLGLSLFRASFKNVPISEDPSSNSRKEKEKASRLKIGRGRRGFERVKKKEEMYRRNMLAYLNTD